MPAKFPTPENNTLRIIKSLYSQAAKCSEWAQNPGILSVSHLAQVKDLLNDYAYGGWVCPLKGGLGL